MVEVFLTCPGAGLDPPHGFQRSLSDPVDWKVLNKILADPDPRCELHPAQSWFDPNADWE